jgi:hydrogenase-4 component H
MFKTIKEILRTGNATIGYPFEPLPQADNFRGKPDHVSADCIACAACAVACPPNAIQMVMDPKAGTITWSINYGRCIFCGRCEEVCPTKTIKLSKEFELAVFDKNDLEETAVYPMQRCTECGRYFASAKEVDYARRIIAQSADADPEAGNALSTIGVCPACKQKADAYRAMRHVQVAGDPTPEPTAAQMAEARRIAEERKGGAR